MKEVYLVIAHYYTGGYGDKIALIGVFQTKEMADEAIKKEVGRCDLGEGRFNVICVPVNKSYTLISDKAIEVLKHEYTDEIARDEYGRSAEQWLIDNHMIEDWDRDPELPLGGYIE